MSRVLFITTTPFDPPFNGATVYTAALVRALGRDHEVEVVVLRNLRRGPDWLRKLFIALRGVFDRNPITVLAHSAWLRDVALNADDYAHVIADHAVSAHWARLRGLPFILVAHNIETRLVRFRVTSPLIAWLWRVHTRAQDYEADAFRAARAVICISATEREEIAREAPVTAHILPAFEAVAHEPERTHAPTRLRIGFIGARDWPPNRAAVTRLRADILPAVARDWRLVLAGRGWRDATDGGVTALGPLRDTSAFWDQIDVLVAPLADPVGTSIKLCEALHHGVAVIAPRAALAAIFGRDAPLPEGVCAADTDQDVAAAIEAVSLPTPRRPVQMFHEDSAAQAMRALLAELDGPDG